MKIIQYFIYNLKFLPFIYSPARLHHLVHLQVTNGLGLK